MRACKMSLIALIILFFCLTTIASLSASIWLSKWADKAKSQIRSNNTVSSANNQIRDMNIYSVLGIVQGSEMHLDDLLQLSFHFLGFLAFAMQLILKLATYVAGRKLHWIILLGVLHAPMSFFDTTPIGRIINRFAKDIDAVDSTLSEAFSQSLNILITVVATLVILIYGSWFVIIGLIPLTVLFAYIQVKVFGCA